MNYTKLFYWLTVADNAKSFFWFFGIIFTIIAGISTIGYIFSCYTHDEGRQTDDDKKIQKICRKWMWWSYPFMILLWSGIIFTPSKKDSLLIVAGGGSLNYLTTDSTAKQIPHELTNFVVTELKTMAKENTVDLNIINQKEKVLNEAKKMSSEEIINKMKNDSIYRKILLNN